MIWAMSIPGPNLITIYGKFKRNGERVTKDPNSREDISKVSLHASYNVPSMLSVNCESRKVALTVYKYAYAHSLNGNGVYLDFSRDAVFVEFNEYLDTFFPKDRPTQLSSAIPTHSLVEDRLKNLALGEPFGGAYFFVVTDAKFIQFGSPEVIAFTRGAGRQTPVRIVILKIA
jgi:hypothetical protein